MCLMYGAGRMNSNRGCKASPCTIACLSARVHCTVLQLFMYRVFCKDTHATRRDESFSSQCIRTWCTVYLSMNWLYCTATHVPTYRNGLAARVHCTVFQLFMYRSFCIDTHESCDTTYRSAANVPDLMYSIFVHELVVLYSYPCADVP